LHLSQRFAGLELWIGHEVNAEAQAKKGTAKFVLEYISAPVNVVVFVERKGGER
jgi:hypothetical protein